MKKLYVILAAILALSAFAIPVLAAQDAGFRVEYDGFGRVEIDFARKADYRDVRISVTDQDGAAYRADILERDDDELDFVVEGVVPGRIYHFTLSGLRFGLTGEYGDVSGSFRAPDEGEIIIKSVEYDGEDRELELELNTLVQFDQLQVTLQDASGKTYDAKLRDVDEDSVELRVERLERGAEYTVTLSGLKLAGFENTVSVSTAFTAR